MSSTIMPSPAGAAAGAAALRPGAVYPLRPLAQDEVFLAAFSVIRRNPRAVLGLPFLAALLTFVVSLLLMVLMPSDAYIRMLTDPLAFENQELTLAAFGEGGLVLLMTVTALVGNLIMALSIGLLTIPALRAAYGLPTTLGQTVALRAGRLGWLVLHILTLMVLLGVGAAICVVLAVLLVLVTFGFGLFLVLPGLFLLLCWITAAFMFGPAAIVVERRNAFSAIARSFQLNRGLWWRHIGAVALLYLMLGVVLAITSLPAGLATGLGAEQAWLSAQGPDDLLVLLVLAVSQAYEVLLSTLLVALIGTILALMYLNSRFRREALDVLLIDATPTELPGSPEHVAAHAASPEAGGSR